MRLYLQNPYMRRFQAKVVDHFPWKGKTALVLNQTAFYPTGGGQPHDTGKLDGYPVVDVEEVGGVILHLIEGEYQGEKELTGTIDWDRRFDHMQQHSGQHLLSDYLKERYGYETLSFHLGNMVSTINISPATPFSIQSVEEGLYEIILENRPIETHFLPREEVERKVLEKTGSDDRFIRFVEIKGFPPQACKGTHPNRTGEIGLIKIIKTENDRGALRIYYLAGLRALHYIQRNMENMSKIMPLFKANEEDLLYKVNRYREEAEELRKTNRRLMQEKLDWEIQYRKTKVPVEQGIQLHAEVFEDRSFQELKELAKGLIESPGQLVLFATLIPQTQVVAACSQEIPFSMLTLLQRLLPGGKGGGSRVFAQYGGEKEELQQRWEGLLSFIMNELLLKG